MNRQFDFEFESSIGNVFIEASADVRWMNGRWDYEEIELEMISDDEGRCVKHLLKPSDYTMAYAKATVEFAKIDIDSECEDALAEAKAEMSREAM